METESFKEKQDEKLYFSTSLQNFNHKNNNNKTESYELKECPPTFSCQSLDLESKTLTPLIKDRPCQSSNIPKEKKIKENELSKIKKLPPLEKIAIFKKKTFKAFDENKEHFININERISKDEFNENIINQISEILDDKIKEFSISFKEEITSDIIKKITDKPLIFENDNEENKLLKTTIINLEKKNEEWEKKYNEIIEKIENSTLQTQSFTYEQLSQEMQNHYIEEKEKMEENCNSKFHKIREYFTKFGEQFKLHLKHYESKKTENDNKLHEITSKFTNFECISSEISTKMLDIESRQSIGFEKIIDQIRNTRSEFNKEFKHINENIKGIKEELNLNSVVQSEIQNMLEIYNISQNEIKLEKEQIFNSFKEMNKKFELQNYLQNELENEMRNININQDEIFKKFNRNESDLEKIKNLLNSLTSSYSIFKRIQEKEIQLKTQMNDLLFDIDSLKNKTFMNEENQQELKKNQLDEINKFVELKINDFYEKINKNCENKEEKKNENN